MKVGEVVDAARVKEPPETNEIRGDHWTISLPKTRIHTLDQLIEYCEVDLSVWEVERFICNKWEVGRKDKTVDLSWTKGAADGYVSDSGRIFVEPLFQVKAFFRKRHDVIAVRKEIEALKALAAKDAPRPTVIRRGRKQSGNALELNIPDIHFGKLSWGRETLGPNYDTSIAKKIYDTGMATVLDRVSPYRFDRVLFPVGNDILQTDDSENRTTKGTVVSTDSRYQKTFEIVRDVTINSILRLREIAPVDVVMVPGNHDERSVWHLGDSLRWYFAKYKDVTIDNEPTDRKYWRFGQVMLMLTHGEKIKFERLRTLMASERREMWGQTRFHEIHCGHTHRRENNEDLGVMIRVMSSISPADAWHAQHGFVNQVRSVEALIWNAEEGLIGSAAYNHREFPEELK